MVGHSQSGWKSDLRPSKWQGTRFRFWPLSPIFTEGYVSLAKFPGMGGEWNALHWLAGIILSVQEERRNWSHAPRFTQIICRSHQDIPTSHKSSSVTEESNHLAIPLFTQWPYFETPGSRDLWRYNFSPERGSQMVFTLYQSLAVHVNNKLPMQAKMFTAKLSKFLSFLCAQGLLNSRRAAALLHYQCRSVTQRHRGWARNKPQLSGLCRYSVNWTCSFVPDVQRLHDLLGQMYSSGVLQFDAIPNPLAINPMVISIQDTTVEEAQVFEDRKTHES